MKSASNNPSETQFISDTYFRSLALIKLRYFEKNSGNQKYEKYCSGVILNNSAVLTTKSCFDNTLIVLNGQNPSEYDFGIIIFTGVDLNTVESITNGNNPANINEINIDYEKMIEVN
jgi:hypothetical protein